MEPSAVWRRVNWHVECGVGWGRRGWDGVAVKLPVGTVQGIYRQPLCLTNYCCLPPLLNGCTATADSSWRGSKSASPTPAAIHPSHRALILGCIQPAPTLIIWAMLSDVHQYLTWPAATSLFQMRSYWPHKKRYPHVADVAKRYLSAPSTSVTSECLFSSAVDLYADSRSRLSGRLADMLLFIKHNLKFIWKIPKKYSGPVMYRH